MRPAGERYRSRMRVSSCIAVAVVAIGVLACVGPAAAAPTCHGLPVTIAKHAGLVEGTPHRDVILLTGEGTVHAGGGRDIVCGSQRADVIDGGAGHDVIVAGAGADHITGGPGRDRIFGEAGADRLDGEEGRDVVISGTDRRIRPRDYVDDSAYGLSLYIDGASLAAANQNGTTFGVMRSAACPAPVWWSATGTTIGPSPLLQTMAVTWPGAYSAWKQDASNSAFPPGGAVTPQATVQAGLGAVLNWNPATAFQVTGTGPANEMIIENHATWTLLLGLAQVAVVDGRSYARSTPQPLTASLVSHGTSTVQQPTQTITVFATQLPASPGSLVCAGAFAQSISVTVTPSDPTALVAYDSSTGFTTDRS